MPLRMSSTASWIVSLRGAFEPGSVLRRRQEEQQEAQQVECFVAIVCLLSCCRLVTAADPWFNSHPTCQLLSCSPLVQLVNKLLIRLFSCHQSIVRDAAAIPASGEECSEAVRKRSVACAEHS